MISERDRRVFTAECIEYWGNVQRMEPIAIEHRKGLIAAIKRDAEQYDAVVQTPPPPESTNSIVLWILHVANAIRD